jgi:hypothetical protein
MTRALISIVGALSLMVAVAGFALGQETTTTTTTVTPGTVTQTTQNSDGSYTVVEYPVGQPVDVNLTPTTMIPGAAGTAHIVRTADGTTVTLNLTGMTGDAGTYNLYAVDPSGAATLLGPVPITNGTATYTTTTPLNRFMLVLSPEANMTTYNSSSSVVLRSAVPRGMAVIPYAASRPKTGALHVESTTTPGGTAPYNVPMLNVPAFKMNAWNRFRVNFTGDLSGSEAEILVRPRRDMATEIHVNFHHLKRTGLADERLVLWGVSPDNNFSRLGQVIITGQRNKGDIHTETALHDFGLFFTVESADQPPQPTGTMIGTVVRETP